MDLNYIVNTNLMMITLLKTVMKVAVLLLTVIRPQPCPRVSTDYHVSTISLPTKYYYNSIVSATVKSDNILLPI